MSRITVDFYPYEMTPNGLALAYIVVASLCNNIDSQILRQKISGVAIQKYGVSWWLNVEKISGNIAALMIGE